MAQTSEAEGVVDQEESKKKQLEEELQLSSSKAKLKDALQVKYQIG